MKILFSSILVIACLSVSFGQKIKYKTEAEYFSKTYGKDKKVLLEKYLDLEEEEATAFWPLYDSYEKKRAEFGEYRWSKLRTYNDEYEGIDDAIADRWLDTVFVFKTNFASLLDDFVAEVKGTIGPLRALQVYEFEAYIMAGTRKYLVDHAAFVEAGFVKKK